MGEIIVKLEMENAVDRECVRRGLLSDEVVRSLTTEAVVETGVPLLMLPREQVEALGLRELRKVLIADNGQRREGTVAGVVTVRMENR